MSSSVVLNRLLKSSRPLVFGMIHLPALPGTPHNKLPLDEILEKVFTEAKTYAQNEIDGVIVENMNDIPYMKPPASPETVSAMTLACRTVEMVRTMHQHSLLTGVQILAGSNKEAMAVAASTGMNFIRAEGFVYGHVADEGYIGACAGELLRYRALLKAEKVAIFTDIKKKHASHAITSDLTIKDNAEDAKFNCADGVIVTGSATGSAASLDDLKQVKSIPSFPVLVGSGVTIENWKSYSDAHGFIIGSGFKYDGKWQNDIEAKRVTNFMAQIKKFRRPSAKKVQPH